MMCEPLLMRRESGHCERLFELESWRVIVGKRADGGVATEATIKVWAPDRKTGTRLVCTARLPAVCIDAPTTGQ